MPRYMFIHPILGLLAVTLILSAFALKAGRRKFRTVHYAAGLAAALAAGAALVVALWAVGRLALEAGGLPVLPRLTTLHLSVALLGVALLVVQVGLGLAVRYVRGGPPRLLRFHRRNGRLLALLAVAILLLGLGTLAGMML
jgi:hypothetical protein